MLSVVIETAIGLALVFYFMALLCSAITEAIANAMKKRAKYLLRGLRELLDDPATAETAPGVVSPSAALASVSAEQNLYNRALAADATTAVPPATPPHSDAPPGPWTTVLMGHPLIRPFKEARSTSQKTRNPSYLPARAFAAALLDTIVPNTTGKTTLTHIRNAVSGLDDATPFKGALVSILKRTEDDVKSFMSGLEQWYDDQMDRISGSYKRWSKRWLAAIAVVLVGLAGIDAIAIGRSLYEDAPLRAAVVAAAANETLCEQDESFEETRECVTTTLTELGASHGLPLGWTETTTPDRWSEWLLKVLGLALTAAAATLGAPFWFDAFNRLGSLRNAGPKPKTTSG
ncbi:hypothetical protein EXU48_20715 [Occultella glacieicola]|uniref:Uncharacterized protein n=1 Tax=Occultella glacieicola TaxID=2518684 RepID=A0ABY2DYW4_9MICO|nr:hypothetical protein [Occultella glacieicola]TDE89583.1 hypothetical protein EXU48_20715 [Occultella glacieicola]